jgi:hypothetical protein
VLEASTWPVEATVLRPRPEEVLVRERILPSAGRECVIIRAMSVWEPHEGEHVIAAIEAKDFPHPDVTGEGTIRVPATVIEIQGNRATVHIDRTLVEGQGDEATVQVSALDPVEGPVNA